MGSTSGCFGGTTGPADAGQGGGGLAEVPEGDESVSAGGNPIAARVGDLRGCPAGAGAILPPGAGNVLIGGAFAARVGDLAACVGAPDMIAMGELSVLVAGMPAARQGDPTAHGGKITTGFPTVMIGKALGPGADLSAECMKGAQAMGSSLVQAGK
ncbi:MAG: PAAR domain-containing protein [Planctomycetota bacterium]